jgi:predicted ATPase
MSLESCSALVRHGTRLVTVTGPGGTGKTRLALQVAAELVGSYKDGVFWVPLAGLRDSKLVLAQVARTLGARKELSEHLRGKELLLLLDNVEHLLAAAPALGEQLGGAKGLRLLVTSRAPLHLSGERQYLLEPLPPRDAVTLFCERARAIGCELTPDETIEAICDRLDGLPLALELAAARTKLLDTVTLLQRLEHALPVLTGGARDTPERQRTLRATIEWSYDLLDPEAKQLFARLAVFAGSFSLEAAEEVCEGDLDALTAVVDISLVKPIGESRFLMLETIREYALERIDASDADVMRQRHSDYFDDLAAEADSGLDGPTHRVWLDRLSEELANIRSALERLLSADRVRALRLATALSQFWWVRAPLEGYRWLEQALTSEAPPELRVKRFGVLAGLAWMADDYHSAERYADEGLALSQALGDSSGVLRSLSILADLASEAGDVVGRGARDHGLSPWDLGECWRPTQGRAPTASRTR